MDTIAHAASRDGQHSSELTATQDSDRAAGENGIGFRGWRLPVRLRSYISHFGSVGLYFGPLGGSRDSRVTAFRLLCCRPDGRGKFVAHPARLQAVRKGKSNDRIRT